nr:major capsid protein [Microviridae sp.]
MNRNSEQHYNQVPTRAEIRRARFKRDYSLLTTMNEGDLVPVYLDEVLPADTFKVNVNALVRMATPLYPVMDNAYMDYYFFFVPARLLWEHFENLMGQNDKTFWAETTEYTTPQTTAPSGGWNVGTLADYFGIPTGVENLSVNSMPFRAYCKIWNEWFRDENLEQPVTMSKTDATTAGSNTGTSLSDAEAGGLPLKVCKYKDYFTSCVPTPEKGDPVGINLAGSMDVALQGNTAALKGAIVDMKVGWDQEVSTQIELSESNSAFSLMNKEGSDNAGIKNNSYESAGGTKDKAYLVPDTSGLSIDTSGLNVNTDTQVNLGDATAISINELRQAIAVQHIFERDARTGTRYKEILAGAWGVTSPDARLDRSEYIGGYRMPINVNQVVQTSATDSGTSPQGNTGAYSMTTMSRNMCTYSATEHGYVIGLAAIRVDHSYQQGLSRLWTRSTRFSYYDPMLANLGEQAVLNQEIYAQGINNAKDDEEVFGYQEAWADYRYRTNQITGEMRSTYAKTLDAWHYADKYTKLPTLSSSWIQEGTENIDRTIAVQSSNSHQFLVNLYYDQTWTRPMPIYSIPGLVDTI